MKVFNQLMYSIFNVLKKGLPVVLALCIAVALIVLGEDEEDSIGLRIDSINKTLATRLLEPHDFTAEFNVSGKVRAEISSDITSEVSGRLLMVMPDLEEGLYVEEGTVLARIENSQYLYELKQAKAALAEAKLALEQAQAEVDQAQKDLVVIGDVEVSTLALGEPQLAFAKAAFDSAKARLLRSQYLMEQTEVKAPYTGFISAKTLKPFEYIQQGQLLLSMFKAENMLVDVLVPKSIIHRVHVLTQLSQKSGKPIKRLDAELLQNWGASQLNISANLLFSSAALDSDSQMQKLIFTYKISPNVLSDMAIKPGSVVTVVLKPEPLESILKIEAEYLNADNAIKRMNSAGEAVLEQIEPVYQDWQYVYFYSKTDHPFVAVLDKPDHLSETGINDRAEASALLSQAGEPL